VVFVAGPAVRRWFGLATPAVEAQESAPAPVDGKAFRVTDRQWAALRIEPVQLRPFETVAETEGKIAIDDDLVTPVFSAYTGRVTRLLARAGDTVRPGDPLFAVQATELAQAQNDLIVAVSGLKTARAQLSLAESTEKRQHALYQAQGAALKDWQQAQVDLATAQGGLNTAQIALAAVRSRLRILGKSDADIDAIERAPDPLKLDADTMVRAPIGGTVVQRQVGLGQNIISASSGASTPVFMIGDLSKVWLVANAREEDAPFLHVGDPIEVHLLAYPGRTFHARLAYVSASIDATTHRLPVRAEVENPDAKLKPEMFASFRIITGGARTSPAVPEHAVVYEGAAAHVWVAHPKSKTLEIRPISAGYTRDGLVQVIDGLRAGERIVTSGAVFIDRAATGD
ncbi:MAG TPA: efflux RND transporter periplasmic adaptor subunit, partial [Rhodopila sp.]|nr:efflux RND transporter periplasmic adaptor subunit [Rhodopila sp.]